MYRKKLMTLECRLCILEKKVEPLPRSLMQKPPIQRPKRPAVQAPLFNNIVKFPSTHQTPQEALDKVVHLRKKLFTCVVE